MQRNQATYRAKADDDLLLTRKEVQERFGISKRFLELATARGDGPTIIRVGRLVRYRASDIRSWIDAQAVRGR